jgi:UPF0176 protein
MAELRNLVSKRKLKEQLLSDLTTRKTISFYKYFTIHNPSQFREVLFVKLMELNVLGRIYVANEGINAQISVPTDRFEDFKNYLFSLPWLKNIRLNFAIDDDGKSFWVLKIKVRKKIVADGIEDENFSTERRGQYVNAKEFNELAQNPKTVIVDMRNYYEYEVGHFENAIEIPSDTFKEQLPMSLEILQDKKEKNIVMYCTGGIRCEKASAYLLNHGFQNVYQLEGGIIEYIRQVKNEGLENKFKGKNFVFDNRWAENVSTEIISNCHQCGVKCDKHSNCENPACHTLVIQCEICRENFQGCCSSQCQKIFNLPSEIQKELRKGQPDQSKPFCNSRKRRQNR